MCALGLASEIADLATYSRMALENRTNSKPRESSSSVCYHPTLRDFEIGYSLEIGHDIHTKPSQGSFIPLYR
jgi:hypothetical protein